MADVKWIKIVTDIFDDEKILMVETLPSADSVIVIWFKLLCFAGKTNNGGVFMMNNRIAYTDEMLAAIFRRDINTVRMALAVFEKYGMIEIVDDVITIPNWGKHQTLDAYEKKKARDRERIARKRAEQRALIGMSPDVSPDTSPDVASLDKEGEEEKEKDINIISDSGESSSAPKTKKPVKHKYGEYKNVLLTDEEMQKLQAEFPDYQERIERLSAYVASTGKSYKSHLATIRNWARKDKEQAVVKPKPNRFHNFTQRTSDLDAMMRMNTERMNPQTADDDP